MHTGRNPNPNKITLEWTFGSFVCTRMNKLSCYCYFIKLLVKGRIYSLPKLQKSRRVTVSRPVCLELQAGFPLGGIFLARDKEKFPPLLVEKGV